MGNGTERFAFQVFSGGMSTAPAGPAASPGRRGAEASHSPTVALPQAASPDPQLHWSCLSPLAGCPPAVGAAKTRTLEGDGSSGRGLPQHITTTRLKPRSCTWHGLGCGPGPQVPASATSVMTVTRPPPKADSAHRQPSTIALPPHLLGKNLYGSGQKRGTGRAVVQHRWTAAERESPKVRGSRRVVNGVPAATESPGKREEGGVRLPRIYPLKATLRGASRQ